MNYEIREVEEGDLLFLSRRLRGADLVELTATYGGSKAPLEALTSSVAQSRIASVGCVDKRPIVVFGLCDWTDRSKFIWACGSPEIADQSSAFLRRSRGVLRDWFQQTGASYFFNVAHAQNRVHLRWLEWCHAEILPAIPLGPLGHDFHPFIIRRTSYV